MYIVVTENKVFQNRILSQLAKQMDAELKKEDFKQIGKDFVLIMQGSQEYEGKLITDLEFVQDLREIQRVSMGKLFRPKPLDTATLLAVVNCLILLIMLVRG